MGATAVLVSFRLGGPDGVSVQAATWGRALERLGFTVARVAGELPDGAGPGDVVLPELALASDETGWHLPQRAIDPARLRHALGDASLVVAENILSLPLNLPASRALTGVLHRHPARALLHHHDLAWQRGGRPEVTELPPGLPGALHATINEVSRRELAERGVEAVVVRNGFDLDAPPGDRESTRRRLGVGGDDLLVLQPTRALERKNVPGALALCGGLASLLGPGRTVRYWLAGPAEDGYAPTLERLLAAAPVPVMRDRPTSMADAYAACDLVAFPSTDEGFGNPVMESVGARRPLAVGHYPVLDEILGLGLSFLPADDPGAVAAYLAEPTPGLLERNLEVARRHFSLEALTRRLAQVMDEAGWERPAPD